MSIQDPIDLGQTQSNTANERVTILRAVILDAAMDALDESTP
jgi:hypothetical protein